ncbi:hypothetical protein BURMUCGD2M_6042 [Burkholderia multivorans CGD2M]|uniref:Uncharacterized protein n=1 Tax=Burkholderia multivorans CGD2 TaxID=513052 RepID=B9BLU3_9BURK|nr:hypothetical protein BURMUCGD2_6051 [Burkholderia multivorans CGD2]EEE16597.1 hypothetical protein BURMUCGD2M_6042 [Burkholderia multivorans CGD2M]
MRVLRRAATAARFSFARAPAFVCGCIVAHRRARSPNASRQIAAA